MTKALLAVVGSAACLTLPLGCVADQSAEGPASAPARDRQSLGAYRPLRTGPVSRPFESTLPSRAQQPARQPAAPEDLLALNPLDPDAAGPAPAAPERDLDVTLNFKAADSEEVFREVFEKILQVQYVLATEASGKKMSFVLEGRVSREELFRSFDSVCEAYGLALQPVGGVVHVVTAQAAQKRGGRLVLGAEGGDGLGATMHVIPLTNATAKDVLEGVKSLLTERGLAAAPAGGNTLIVSDSPSNIGRVLQIIRELDRPFFAGRTLRLYSPRHAEAKELASALNEQAKAAGARTGVEGSAQFNAVELPRSRQVMVMTTLREFIPTIDSWVQRIDRPTDADKVQTFFYTAQHASAATLSSAIAASFDGPDAPKVTIVGAGAQAGGVGPASTPSPGGQSSSASQTSASGARQSPQSSAGSPGFSQPLQASDGERQTLVIRCKPEVYREVREVIRVFDPAPKQVALQVVVAEVVLSGGLQFGLELFTRQKIQDNLFYELRSAAGTISGDPTASAFILGNNALAAVRAAANEGDVRVLSTPFTVATSGKSAQLNVGKEVPIQTQTVSGGADAADPTRIAQSIEYRKTGVILNVVPIINDSGEVTLQVQQEVSDVEDPAANAVIRSPSFPQRQIQTTVTMRSGETAVLGGIRRDRDQITRRKVPVLGDIPVLGEAFKNKEVTREQTELVVLLSATILLTPEDLDSVTSQYLDSMINMPRIDELIEKRDVDTMEMLLR